ncbi:MAG TPA: GGDEF domain-containing protein [Mycobacterium sp.]|nr:GGDEF domain-containing protein [Mycobacterium sp.]
MGWLGLWWRQPDHYDELSSHLQARNMTPLGRATISLIVGGMAVIALATIWAPTGPHGPVAVACALAAFAGGMVGALLWALCLPSRTASIRFVVLCDASIALAALAQHDPLGAMLACTAFATLASFIALFHTPPLMAFNFAIAGVIGAVEGLRIAAKFNVVAALSSYAMLLLLNLVVPFGIQVLVHVLGADALRAERDELTGLLTRRAFRRRAKARLEQSRDQFAHFVIAMIDLDHFKRLNDNYGHSTGDDALASVARVLVDTTGESAIICRSGGEEFVIADIWHPDEVGPRAQQLCEVIAALSFGVTASIGTAGVHPAQQPGDSADLLAELIAAADDAMYVAKRRGGNQAGHHRWPSPPLDGFAADERDYPGDGLTA